MSSKSGVLVCRNDNPPPCRPPRYRSPGHRATCRPGHNGTKNRNNTVCLQNQCGQVEAHGALWPQMRTPLLRCRGGRHQLCTSARPLSLRPIMLVVNTVNSTSYAVREERKRREREREEREREKTLQWQLRGSEIEHSVSWIQLALSVHFYVHQPSQEPNLGLSNISKPCECHSQGW